MKNKMKRAILLLTLAISLFFPSAVHASNAADASNEAASDSSISTHFEETDRPALAEDFSNDMAIDLELTVDGIQESPRSDPEVVSSRLIQSTISEDNGLVGTTFDTKFGTYQILTTGEHPTAALVGNPYRDYNGNFVYGSSERPWAVKYEDTEYAVTEIQCKLSGVGTAVIPEGVTYIQNGTFTKNTFRHVELPSTLEHFDEDHTFFNLESITVAEDNPYYKVEDGALLTKDGSALLLYPAERLGDSYVSPESVKIVDESAFFNNMYLKIITLTKVERINDYAFYMAQNVETINLPSTLISLGTMAVFYDCPNLKTIHVEDRNPILHDIDGVLYFKDDTDYMLASYPAAHPIESYTIPYGVSSICQFAFTSTSYTSEITIPASVKQIYSYAFEETDNPITFILQHTNPLSLSQSCFDRLTRGSQLIVESEQIKNGFREDFLTTYLDETGGTKIDTKTPILIDYERAVSRYENWYRKDGRSYYYDIDGNLVQGLCSIQSRTYFFDPDGSMETGFHAVDGKTYYFDPDTGARVESSGIHTFAGKDYLLKDDYSLCLEHEYILYDDTYFLDPDTGEILCDSRGWTRGHAYGSWNVTLPATCQSQEIRTHSCTRCGHQEERTFPKSGHTFSDWTVLKEASCSTNGQKSRTCSACGTSETAEIPAKSHRYGTWTVKRNATYSDSEVQIRTCSLCGFSETRQLPRLSRKKISLASVKTIRWRVYNGRLQTPPVKIRYADRLLKKGRDYILSYRKNRKPGKAVVLVKGIGAYQGTVTVSFFISPKAPRIRNVKPLKKGALILTWKKSYGASGFQVSCSKNQRFQSARKLISRGSSKIIQRLSSKKKYYVRMRAYTESGGRKIYGPYSAILGTKVP